MAQQLESDGDQADLTVLSDGSPAAEWTKPDGFSAGSSDYYIYAKDGSSCTWSTWRLHPGLPKSARPCKAGDAELQGHRLIVTVFALELDQLKLKYDLDVVGLALICVLPVVEAYAPRNHAAEPGGVGLCERLGTRFVVAPVGIYRAEHESFASTMCRLSSPASMPSGASLGETPVRQSTPLAAMSSMASKTSWPTPVHSRTISGVNPVDAMLPWW